MRRLKCKAIIDLPIEFVDLCDYDMIEPEAVLRGFIADLCALISWASRPRADGYNSNGSDERDYARAYYDRVGYPYWAQWQRENAEGKLTDWVDMGRTL